MAVEGEVWILGGRQGWLGEDVRGVEGGGGWRCIERRVIGGFWSEGIESLGSSADSSVVFSISWGCKFSVFMENALL